MMKSKGLTMMMAMAAMGVMPHGGGKVNYEPERETPEEKRQKQAKINKAKGLTLFYVDGVEVWARDYKNAERKAKNTTKP